MMHFQKRFNEPRAPMKSIFRHRKIVFVQTDVQSSLIIIHLEHWLGVLQYFAINVHCLVYRNYLIH